MAKTNFGEWAKDINWIKVSFVVIVAVLLVYVYRKLFGQDGWIATGWGYVQEGTEWLGVHIQDAYQNQIQIWDQGIGIIEKSAIEAYEEAEEGVNALWDYFTK